MATITVQQTSTFSGVASAFGPNLTKQFSNLVLSTVQSPVTAFVTSYAFQNVYPYHEDDGYLFTFLDNALTALPVQITSTGLSGLVLSAHVDECALGAYTGSLALTLSSLALSATSVSSVSSVSVANTHQTLTWTITAKNLPYHHHLCKDRYDRMRDLGIF